MEFQVVAGGFFETENHPHVCEFSILSFLANKIEF